MSKRIKDHTPRFLKGGGSRKFVDAIAWRLYTEYCCKYRGNDSYIRAYDGKECWQEWVNAEIHYALGRRLKGLSEEEISQINRGQLYGEVRIDVLRAVVRRAIELFSAWEGKGYPPEGDKRNLRGSLEEYLPGE